MWDSVTHAHARPARRASNSPDQREHAPHHASNAAAGQPSYRDVLVGLNERVSRMLEQALPGPSVARAMQQNQDQPSLKPPQPIAPVAPVHDACAQWTPEQRPTPSSSVSSRPQTAYEPLAEHPVRLVAPLPRRARPAASMPPTPLNPHQILQQLHLHADAVKAAEQQGIVDEVAMVLAAWANKYTLEGLNYTWTINEAGKSLLMQRWPRFVAQMQLFATLPFFGQDGRMSFVQGDNLYMLTPPCAQKTTMLGLTLTGTRIRQLLALPSGLFVLWQSMSLWEELVAFAPSYESLAAIAAQPEGEMVLSRLCQVRSDLTNVGFVPTMLLRIASAAAGFMKLGIAHSTRQVFAEGRMSCAAFVEMCLDISLGVTMLAQLMFAKAKGVPQMANAGGHHPLDPTAMDMFATPPSARAAPAADGAPSHAG